VNGPTPTADTPNEDDWVLAGLWIDHGRRFAVELLSDLFHRVVAQPTEELVG
jgi:hypothetical protein